jgi:hypothetical protein
MVRLIVAEWHIAPFKICVKYCCDYTGSAVEVKGKRSKISSYKKSHSSDENEFCEAYRKIKDLR